MIRLLIADDEHIVAESIKYIIDNYINNVEVIGTAYSGREAIEKAIDLKPDIIFMDIRMPGINGIDAIRQIKERNRDMVFVVVSAYEYFDYAKEAVNLGVYEYILKPINKTKVINTIKEINNIILKRRVTIQQEIQLKEKISKIIPHIEGQFIHTQLFNGRVIKDIDFYEDVFGMSIKQGYVLMGIVEEDGESTREESIKYSIAKQSFYEIFSVELKKLTPCLIGPPLLDRTVAYIPTDETIDTYEARNLAIKLAAKLGNKIDRVVSVKYTLGLGRIYNIENFSKSCNEAYMAVTLSNNDPVTHFEDISPSLNKVDLYPSNKEKKLIHFVLRGDEDESLDIFEEIFWWFSVNYKDDIDRIKSRLIEMLIVINRSLPYDFDENIIDEQSYLIAMLKINNCNELKISYIDHLRRIIKFIKEQRKDDLDGLISKAIDYINTNYQDNISLDHVAQEINMSYHYFSKFFKDSVGKNFVDYLTELRIHKSKEFLQESNLSVKEICYEIGYSDPNYFSKTFKKVTGMTPTEYRTNFILQESV